jgi:hypothetical protein
MDSGLLARMARRTTSLAVHTILTDDDDGLEGTFACSQ